MAEQTNKQPQRPRVVIVGGGFGGLQVAKKLKNAEVDLTLVNKTNYHLFQPLLYQVAMSALPAGDIAYPLRAIFSRQKNIRIVMDEAARVDRANRRLYLRRQSEPLHYDYLVLAVGNQPTYYGNDQWKDRAPGLKTLPDAINIRERVLLAFEEAARIQDPNARNPYFNFVVVGGGPTGVEVAGAIAEIGAKTMTHDYPMLDKSEIQVYLLEGGDRILNTYSPKLSDRARRDLEKMGVIVKLNTMVSAIKDREVLAGENLRIPTVNVIWAAGNAASPLLKTLETEQLKDGRVKVAPDLSVPGDENVFVIGDAAYLKDANGLEVPGIAPAANQMGSYVAKQIEAGAPAEWRAPFEYFDKGQMATIGRAKAILESGKLKLTGLMAWLAWSVVHIFFLIGFRNRFSVVFQWFWYYITFQPGSRIIFWRDPMKARSDTSGPSTTETSEDFYLESRPVEPHHQETPSTPDETETGEATGSISDKETPTTPRKEHA